MPPEQHTKTIFEAKQSVNEMQAFDKHRIPGKSKNMALNALGHQGTSTFGFTEWRSTKGSHNPTGQRIAACFRVFFGQKARHERFLVHFPAPGVPQEHSECIYLSVLQCVLDPLAVWTVSSCRFSRFPKFATCWSCTHLHKSPLRTAVTLGPLFDAYLLNIGGKCLASTPSNANMKASAKRSDVFHSYMDGLQELQLRHGNKLVGAVESTQSP